MATIKDVARDAGVAVGTVSKVINGQHVNEENKIKVQESIRKLGYRVNFYARGLKMQTTNTVTVIMPTLLNPFFAALVHHIERELSVRNYKMILCLSGGRAGKEKEHIFMASQNKVDGIIAITYSDSDKYLQDEFPMVSIDRHFKSKICCVASDNYHGGELAARKMIDTGSKNLLYLWTGSRISNETLKRRTGFLDLCRKEGISCEAVNIDIHNDENTPGKIYDYLSVYLAESRLVDGIFCSGDELAAVVIEQLEKLGKKVPEDVQVIGYDGMRVNDWKPYVVSSIQQPIQEIARTSVVNILKLIEKEDVEDITDLPVTFVDGGTTR